MEKSISIIIPAYNEGREIETTINDVDRIVGKLFNDYELLIFDDCSTDETGEVLDKLAAKNSKIRVFHNKKNMNMGYNFRVGIKHAEKEYVMLLSGPDSVSLESIENFLAHVGEAPVISAYIANQEIRQRYRRNISFLVTSTLNIIFGLHLRYYFGMQIYKTKLAKEIKLTTNSFALLGEILVRLIKKGCQHKELPYYVRKSKGTSTTAFRARNVAGVVAVVIKLFFDIILGRIKK